MSYDECKGCTKRKVTADYNCHSHCKAYIKRRLLAEFKYRKANRMRDAVRFSYDEMENVRKLDEKRKRRDRERKK